MRQVIDEIGFNLNSRHEYVKTKGRRTERDEMRINRYKYYQPSLNKNANNVLGKRSNQRCAGILPSANIEINDEIPLTRNLSPDT